MSKKLNKKLVFVVGSLVLILGLVGMLSLVMLQGNTERHIRAGDEFLAAKDYRKAADTYGRAVAKKATNLDYLAKLDQMLSAFLLLRLSQFPLSLTEFSLPS